MWPFNENESVGSKVINSGKEIKVFAKNKLKPKPICSTCNDTGIVFGVGMSAYCGWCEAGDKAKDYYQ